ncbi:hypothetical protein L917_11137 [Phytophthora nicotianae]|uniref:Uncharacterized protein n=1 Tax=Phytophthora nicotianae TaxID=4792 RepID=W2KY09_PHYNI|nr:hypothetical protein L917_11137 [Phytophthora nicotianae]
MAMLDAQADESAIDVGVNDGRIYEVKREEEAVSPDEQQIVEEISLQKMRLEDMVPMLYLSLLDEGTFLASESWVLDSLCGFVLNQRSDEVHHNATTQDAC